MAPVEVNPCGGEGWRF